jgi:quercetin dioxygenase-like cupin family protein
MMVVEYAPGAASPPDLHPRPVFGYVLQGSVEIGTGKHQPIAYSEGDLWYEAPRQTPRMVRNASATEPAKIITFLIAEKDRPLEPVRITP